MEISNAFSTLKKGHTKEKPKLRGITLSSLLPNTYDIILNNRFIQWYRPNIYQAGFRPRQGCLYQIFTIILMIELANKKNKTILIGFMDYEKAFDFVNRADAINDLIKKGAGKKFITSIANMYDITYYTPKINNHTYGESIFTYYGVTQVRKTSTNVFSFNTNISLVIDEHTTTEPAENGKYIYLGMLLVPTNDVTELIKANLKYRSFNIKKYFDWLEVNENTPIKIKLQVLDACMFTA